MPGRVVATLVLLQACHAPVDERTFEGDDPGECADGADNDVDGFFDCDDPGCAGAPDCRRPDDGDTASDSDDTDGSGSCPPNEWAAPDSFYAVTPPPETLCPEGTSVGQVVSDARGADQHGTETSLWQFYGQPVLVVIGVMWCGPCQKLAIDLESIRADFDDELVVVQVLFENEANDFATAEDLAVWTGFPAYHPDPEHPYDTFRGPVISDFRGTSGLAEAVERGQFPVALLVGSDLRVERRVEPVTDGGIRAGIDDYFGR